VAEQLLAIKETIRRNGKQCGLIATSHENLLQRREQGFRLLGLGLDAGLLLRGLTAALAVVNRDQPLVPSFMPEKLSPAAKPPAVLDARPAGFEPDRKEVLTPRATARRVELERGVILQPLVGAHNQARNLTTGIVTFMPGAQLPYHQHPHGEAVTVLAGEMAMEVAGRRYHLRPLDHIWIPAGTPHQAVNIAASKPALVHVAMDTAAPERTLVENTFRAQAMAESSTGMPGAEHVGRHATTAWYEPSPGARFQDFYNRDLGSPNLSGGYGIFEPGARLPCHIHDFDESITIVEGTAICIVEGREYSVADYTTALAPRGRCHYFINRSRQPMAMVWVYAGGLPQRLVLNEKCCAVGGCA
jgi:quercetin dioxygenase-like cupin family protein